MKRHLESVKQAIEKLQVSELERAVGILRTAREDGHGVFLVGNGGSAATCAHFANDLLKMAGIKAFDVPSMTPVVTAFGNDEGWENMFSEVLRALADEMDVLVAVTCSGNSQNVISAMQAAQDVNMYVILLTGDNEDSRAVRMEPDVIIPVESDDIKVQEDVHVIICHALAGELAEG